MAALLLFGKDESIASFIPAYRFEAIYRNKTYGRFVLNEVTDSTRYDDRPENAGAVRRCRRRYPQQRFFRSAILLMS